MAQEATKMQFSTDDMCPAYRHGNDEEGFERELCANWDHCGWLYCDCSGNPNHCERTNGPPEAWVRRLVIAGEAK